MNLAAIASLHDKEAIGQYLADWLERGHQQWQEQQRNPTPTMLRLRKLRAEREAKKQDNNQKNNAEIST